MKIWTGHISEHSMNLVMIGHFKTEHDAKRVESIINEIIKQYDQESVDQAKSDSLPKNRFSKKMIDIFEQYNISTLLHSELEQFVYDMDFRVEDSKIILTTDEIEISSFLKLLIETGAHIEVYSAHDFPERTK